MLKNILSLENVQTLSKSEQKRIQGKGGYPVETCWCDSLQIEIEIYLCYTCP